MALGTLVAEFTAVNVIRPVTAHTAGRERDIGRDRDCLTVAAVAIEVLVRSIEREVGLSVVIEPPGEPVDGCVTQRTFGAEPRLVNVVFDVAIDTLLGRIEKRMGLVAILAGGLAVRSEQRKLRQVVIESDVVGPGQLGVAAAAIIAELHLVRIVLFVAADAGRRGQAVGNGSYVTTRAFDVGVGAVQRKVGVDGVVEANVEPLRLSVTVLAFGSVDAVVSVVLEVAADAGIGRRDLELVALVTGLANEARMAVDQREGGRREMIESRLLPVDRRVAILAFRAIHAHVGIVLAMAADARIGRFGVLLADVTAHAGQIVVGSGQRVTASELMVVKRIGPLGFTVTVGTDFAEIPHVLIVLEMAGNTLGLGSVESRLLGVAVDAVSVEMAVAQQEARQAMIERLLDETDDIGIATFVIGMARHALAIAHFGRHCVESRVSLEIGGDLRVAVETKRPLRAARKANVTGGALGFVLGVTGNQRSRHDQALESAKLCLNVHRCRQARAS